jgi:hypothetical protein
VEVVAFGLEATRESLEVLGADTHVRMSSGAPFVIDSGNRILDCDFGSIADPARLDQRIRRIVGVVESGLFIGRADPVFVADAAGVHRPDSARAHRGSPPILVLMGVSGSGKSTIAEELSGRLGWPFEEGDSLHPESNVAKMHAGIPPTDADREPWLERVDQSGRALACRARQKAAPSRCSYLCPAARSRYPRLHRSAQQKSQALQMDQICGTNSGFGKTLLPQSAADIMCRTLDSHD